VIKDGYDQELDDLRSVRDGARDFIASLQAREREATGIGSLKVGFNKVFGYYLEVTKANLSKVPEDYVRKQTLANAERFFTPELKEWEEKVFGAEDRIQSLETELFSRVREEVANEVARIQETAGRLARVDVLATLAEVAVDRAYTRPEVHSGFEIEVAQGRHPVVETMMPTEEFIPNDLVMDEEGRIIILTGPNMAGKSTVLRQVGLIQLLAQMGAFVPASSARLPVCDRIFTRVGALDNLSQGQSTFMVEMQETANILNNATAKSLVIMDEIGRGTSTFDGLSIAWAVAEYLHDLNGGDGVKTLFATHYHELTELARTHARVKNLNIAVKEWNDEIIFLRKLVQGGTNRSYGIQVARLAGIPPPVIDRAKRILYKIEQEDYYAGGTPGPTSGTHSTVRTPVQLDLFSKAENRLIQELVQTDISRMTPLEALNFLNEFQEKLKS
jgi:DNA mismatch repair protein MutS